MKTAICSGSFDPVTLGHLDIIRRAAACFDQVWVCVSPNAEKRNQMFSPEQKLLFVETAVADLPNVGAELFPGLLADFAAAHGADVIVRGVRCVTDFDVEYQMALINRKLNPRLETMFLPSSAKYTYLSSSVVKEMAFYGSDLSDFVPREIIGDVNEKMRQRREG